MELNEFDAQMNRLRETYGDRVYPRSGERDKAIWDRVKAFPARQFEAALTSIIGDSMTAPPVSRIVDATVSARNAVTFLTSGPSPSGCEACSDTGIGFVEHIVHKCICPAGAKIGPAELAKQQGNYDKGRKMFPSPFDKQAEGKQAAATSLFKPLPYNPRERGSA